MTKKRQTKHSSTHRPPKSTHWQASLKAILRYHNPVAARSGKAASYATQAARSQVLWQGFKRLKVLGYKLKDVRNFRETHLKVLAQDWETKGLSPSRIQNNISIFRTFSGWIGKPGMIRASHHYVKNVQSVKRQTATRTDKTWSGQGVDIAEQLNKVADHDPNVAMVLKLQMAFGLRMKEASLLRIHQADRQHYLMVNWGTKGGRDGVVPIEHAWQRQILKEAQALVKRKSDSLIPREKNFKQWQDYFYYTCRKAGISKKNNLTSHGLRHERLNQIYQEKTGELSPIKGGTPCADKEQEAIARQEVAEIAGHSRPKISSAYFGNHRLTSSGDNADLSVDTAMTDSESQNS